MNIKKIVLVFGLILGTIMCSHMLYTAYICYHHPETISNDVIGYAAMIVTFSLIFVGIKVYRDKYSNRVISFGKAFKIGAYIILIASSMYVLVWLFDYYLFIPDFIDKFSHHVLYQAKMKGATPAELDQKIIEMANLKELYKNPFYVVLITYSEVLPLGLVIALLSALILKRKPADAEPASLAS